MNFETLVKVGVAALSVGVATYGCVKAFRRLKEAKAETQRIIAEGEAIAEEMAKQTVEMEAQEVVAEARHQEVLEEIQQQTEQREVEFQETMERMDREEQEEIELFEAAKADPNKIDQLIQHFERGFDNDRQRKGTRRTTHPRRGKRSASGE